MSVRPSMSGSPFVVGTNDREAYPKFWYAAVVKMNCEKRVANQLLKLKVTNYVPIQDEVHLWSDRKKHIQRVLIPMVVFVRAFPEELPQLRAYSFITRFMTMPGSGEIATPIPDQEIERLKFLLDHADSPVELMGHLSVGDSVRITTGKLKGLIGELVMAEDGKATVGVRIHLLGCACVILPRANLEILVDKQ